jgi:hypothetical protein
MIIGISGFAGSGKDTSAEFLIKNHDFGRIGLADKLKRMAKDAFDFSDDQMWGPSSFRNAPDKRYPRKHTWLGVGEVERECACCGEKWGNEEFHSLREPVSQCYLTPRFALQRLGTEWGRNCYDDVWIADAVRTAQKLVPPMSYSAQRGLHVATSGCTGPGHRPGEVCHLDVRGGVFSDIRFHNEVRGVRGAGGKLIRLKRVTSLEGATSYHQSEREMLEMKDEDFDVVIDNYAPTVDEDPDTGERIVISPGTTLEELEQKVTKAFESLC